MKQRTALFILLFVTLVLQAFGHDNAGPTARQNEIKAIFHSLPQALTISTYSNKVISVQIDYLIKEEQDVVKVKFSKKRKTRFLPQHLNFSHLFKKANDKLLDSREDYPVEIALATEYSNRILIRPGYYIFLFRLSPF